MISCFWGSSLVLSADFDILEHILMLFVNSIARVFKCLLTSLDCDSI